MEVVYSEKAIEHIQYWKQSGQKTIQTRITKLINDIVEHPYTGIGKPEPLKHSLSGCWSRRINDEHRLVYEIKDTEVHIHSLKNHY